MGSDERERVQARVSPERKRKWMEAVENNSKYNNLSHLVIRSVENELREDEEPRIQSEDVTADVDLSPVIEGIDELKNELTSVDEKITSLQAQSTDTPDLDKLSQEILRLIPAKPNVVIEDVDTVSNREEERLMADIEQHGLVEDIIELFTTYRSNDAQKVRLAIEKLKTDMNRVDETHDRLLRDI